MLPQVFFSKISNVQRLCKPLNWLLFCGFLSPGLYGTIYVVLFGNGFVLLLLSNLSLDYRFLHHSERGSDASESWKLHAQSALNIAFVSWKNINTPVSIVFFKAESRTAFWRTGWVRDSFMLLLQQIFFDFLSTLLKWVSPFELVSDQPYVIPVNK